MFVPRRRSRKFQDSDLARSQKHIHAADCPHAQQTTNAEHQKAVQVDSTEEPETYAEPVHFTLPRKSLTLTRSLCTPSYHWAARDLRRTCPICLTNRTYTLSLALAFAFGVRFARALALALAAPASAPSSPLDSNLERARPRLNDWGK